MSRLEKAILFAIFHPYPQILEEKGVKSHPFRKPGNGPLIVENMFKTLFSSVFVNKCYLE
jgi:hypothetical protein